MGQIIFHGFSIRMKFGFLCKNCDIHIFYLQPFFSNQLANFFQKLHAVGIFKLLISVRKVQPNVSQSCCAQECVHYGMREDISVGMTIETLLVRDVDACEDESPPAHQLMKIKSLPNSQRTVPYRLVILWGSLAHAPKAIKISGKLGSRMRASLTDFRRYRRLN